MSRIVSDDFKKAVFAQNTNECFIILLTISHPSFTDDIRVASDPRQALPEAGARGVISRDEEYVFLPFDIKLPVQDDTGIARASISIDNIGRDLMQPIRSTNSALRINIEVVLASNPDQVEVSITDFRLERVQYDAMTVSGEITVEYFDLEPFPYKRMTPSDCPGLF